MSLHMCKELDVYFFMVLLRSPNMIYGPYCVPLIACPIPRLHFMQLYGPSRDMRLCMFAHSNIDTVNAINYLPFITCWVCILTSPKENIFGVTGPLWGESSGYQWIPLTKASDVELWCFLWSAPEQTVGQTLETPVIRDAIVVIMTSL